MSFSPAARRRSVEARGPLMRQMTFLLLCVVLLFGAVSTLRAHEETYLGTVNAVESARIRVKVIDQKSKRETSMDFGVTAKTKVFRGDKTVSFADARIQKDERIAVTIDHDVPGHSATVIRLGAAR